MENANYIALSTLTALGRQMDVHANNIANINTTAHRAQRVIFEEYLATTDEGHRISYVLDKGVVRDLAPGPLAPTGNAHDLAINGRGFFVVEADGATRYTRNGHFKVDPGGTLMTATGAPVLDDGGARIVLPPGETEFDVARDGTVSTPLGPIARLALVTFANEQELRPIGEGLYTTEAEARPIAAPNVLQGMIEGSNVKPVVEMVEMMSIARRYQSVQSMLSEQENLQRRAISRLAGNT